MILFLFISVGVGYVGMNNNNNSITELYFDQTLPIWEVGIANPALYKLLAIFIDNSSWDLPKEIDRGSKNKESDFEFKAFGSHGMNRCR